MQMSVLKISVGILYLVVILFVETLNGNPSFLGGTMTFTLEDNLNGTVTAHMQVLAGWQLGTGPCGQNCSRLDTNHQTHRQLLESTVANSSLFGNYTKFPNIPMNKEERNSFNETIISVNELLGWEQEVMTFRVELHPNAEKEKVIYQGQSWKNLSLQGQDIAWKFTASINTNIRNDTKKRNQSPKIKLNPYYRIEFEQTSFIDLPVVDDDDDRIQCEFNKDSPSYLEIGTLNKKIAPGITILENCTVKVNASYKNNYTGDDWIAVTVAVKETNKYPLLLGSTVFAPSKATLSKLQIQFAVHVQRNSPSPMFVLPTPEPMHSFVLYAGATWNTDMFAESHNGLVNEFIASGTMANTWIISAVKPDSKGRQNTFQSKIKLANPMYETGQNIACITAVNENRGESLESRCFRIIVKDSHFKYTPPRSDHDKPYFVYMPSPNEIVKCPMDDTCILPIYVKSNRNVTIIDYTRSGMEHTDVLQQISNIKFKEENVYKTDLSVRNSQNGEVTVCLQATDENQAKSDELCVTFVVIPPDPCVSAPCLNGQCVFSEETGSFYCICTNVTTGRLCETLINKCDPNPCEHGRCYPGGRCYCTDDGKNPNDYSGLHCTMKINDCPNASACNDNGICEDGYKNYTCHCFGGFSGKECQINQCSNSSTNASCVNDGCPDGFCSHHGACSNGFCYCGIGYIGDHCEKPLDIPLNAGSNGDVHIIEPTLSNGSMIPCNEQNHVAHDCIFDVYITSLSVISNLKVSTTSSADLAQNVRCTNFTRSSLFQDASMYVMRCYLNGSINQKDGQYVCVKVEAGEDKHDTVCYEFEIVPDQIRKKRQSSETFFFLPPTPPTGSRFPVLVNKKHTTLLFTSPYNGNCTKLQTTSPFIHLLEPVYSTDGSNICITQMVAQFNKSEETVVLLRYGTSQRRYTFIVTESNLTDPCASTNICQNDGVCFVISTQSHKCICGANYTGISCERGPCHGANSCQNGGKCFVNNETVTCVCRPGYYGTNCSNVLDGSTVDNTLHKKIWPIIDRTSGNVRHVECNTGKDCEVYAFVAYNERPHVALGFMSKGIDSTLEIIKEDSVPGMYQVIIHIISKHAGMHTVCMQTFSSNGTNNDEACFAVNVKEGTDLVYALKSRPHFVSPSLQMNSVVECETGGQCRVSYNATPGPEHKNMCISASLSTDRSPIPFEHVVYSSCESCQDNRTANTNCIFDVMFVPNTDVKKNMTICLTLRLSGLPQIEGEQRCFKVENPKPGRGVGCRNLPCMNGGFCDGQNEDSPVCFCKKGYSGRTCEISSASATSNACIKQFLGKNSLNFTCKVGDTCSFPVEVCGANSMTMELAYDTALLDVTMGTDIIIGRDSCCQFRKVNVKANTIGTRMFCVQMSTSSGTIEYEVCPYVHILDDSPVNIDKGKPHFVPPTLPKTTTFVCKVREVCHILMYFVESDIAKNTSCPALKDTSTNEIEGLHVFPPEVSNDYCVSDVSFNFTSKGTFSLCLQVLIASKQGEERCFQIQVVEDSNVPKETGLCKGITCFGKGVCVANFNNPQNCSCPEDFEGHDCSIERTSPEPRPTTKGTTTKLIDNDQNVPVGSATAVNEAAKPRGSTETNTVSSSEEEPPKAGGSVATTAGIGAGGLAGVSVVGVAIFKIISMKKRQSNKVEDEA